MGLYTQKILRSSNFILNTWQVPKFHLHLSMDDNSENPQRQFIEISQAEISGPGHSLKSIFPEEKAKKYKLKASQDADSTYLPTSLLPKSDNLSPQYTRNNLDNGTKHGDHVKLVEVDDITAAVELSIAASEALLIHEMIDSGQTESSLSASAILEVALRVKQARVECYIEASNIVDEETSDIDYLSDLDDSTMKDAYEEVGLTICALHLPGSDLNISQVRDTYSLENKEGDEKLYREDLDGLGVDSADISTKQRPQDFASFGIQLKGNNAFEPFDDVKQKNLSDDFSLGPEPSDIAFDVNVPETPENVSTTKVVLTRFYCWTSFFSHAGFAKFVYFM